MTDAELKAHIELAKKATPGPWKINHVERINYVNSLSVKTPYGAPEEICVIDDPTRDAECIAANSPEVVIALCEEVLRLRKATASCIDHLGRLVAIIVGAEKATHVICDLSAQDKKAALKNGFAWGKAIVAKP
jgi:hypothetical protein